MPSLFYWLDLITVFPGVGWLVGSAYFVLFCYDVYLSLMRNELEIEA